MDRATRLHIARTLRAAASVLRAEASLDQWTKVTLDEVRRNPRLADELFDLISNAYRGIGGHFKIRSPQDLVGGEVTFYEAVDLDTDADVDAVNLVDTKPAGEKYVGMGHDGSPGAKNQVVKHWGDGMKQEGVFAEVSDALAHVLLTRHHVPVVTSEADVRNVLRKNVEWVGQHPEGKYPGLSGWYYRDIAGHRHLKILVGKPRT